MRKGFLMGLAVALVAVLAAPAVAGTDINGFYRAKGYVTNFDFPSAPTITNDMTTGGYVEQRLRMRFSFGEENVKAIAFFEIDLGSWGDVAGSANSTTPATGASRNAGGALGADRINLETKNVYVWFKVPNTSLDFSVGLQNQTDSIQGLLYGYADMAGIFATGKFEPVSWKLGWAKWYENNVQNWDDMTLYMAYVNFAPSKTAKVGIGAYVIQDDTGKTTSVTQLPYQTTFAINPALNGNISTSPPNNSVATNTKLIYTFPIDFAVGVGPGSLSGFALYQFGTVEFTGAASSRPDIDISAFAADLRFDMNLGPGKFFLEGLVLGGGDNSGNDYQAMVTASDLNASPGGNSYFARMDYTILMANIDDMNQNTCLIGCAGAVGNNQSPGNGGRGLWTVGLGYSMKVQEKTTFKVGGGYLAAVKKLQTDRGDSDTDMGWEVNANVNYNIMKGLDFGLYGAWAMLGDFYKGGGPTGTVTSSNNDPDDLYTMYMRLNYAF
ncbi:MAG TPA: porin [Candidatus Deferrimicrobiaceae bacterium]